ncbi:SRPBCC family protein [Hyphomicrobium sp.]|uniref:SRPBCC family protein n=1 Tax=Hyphomicrobium sp. TaxID=82 RepID=UPI002FE1C49E
MKTTTLAAIALTLSFAAGSADAVEIKKQLPVQGTPEAIWKIANEFCSIQDWHPDFSGCTQSMKDGVVWRVLTLKEGGGKVHEKLTDVDDLSYTYSITEAPLPLKDHTGKIWVEKSTTDGESLLRWEVSFGVNGDAAKTQEVTKAIDGILDKGLANIKTIAANGANCK